MIRWSTATVRGGHKSEATIRYAYNRFTLLHRVKERGGKKMVVISGQRHCDDFNYERYMLVVELSLL